MHERHEANSEGGQQQVDEAGGASSGWCWGMCTVAQQEARECQIQNTSKFGKLEISDDGFNEASPEAVVIRIIYVLCRQVKAEVAQR